MQVVTNSFNEHIAIYLARNLVLLFLLSSLSIIGMGCSDEPGATFLETDQTIGKSESFANLDSEYIGTDACASCHEDIVESYQSHGMANSMYPTNRLGAVPDLASDPVYDSNTNFYYRLVNDGSVYYQEEYRIVNGQEEHLLRHSMDWVIGSGNAARTYLSSINDTYFELPLTWYADDNSWKLSPGYEKFNQRFSRRIPDRCIACHNAYPEKTSPKEGQFSTMPEGISCERCHGPGSLHADDRLAIPEVTGEVDRSIVNPAHLTLDGRMDVCQQCHLNADISIVKDGVGEFGYRPSRDYFSQLALFSSQLHSKDEIKVISHVERMKLSECSIATLDTSSPLECTTCHDPHDGFRDKGPSYFNDACLSCHSPDSDSILPSDSDHNLDASNCISCHMPKVYSSDVVHSSFTDHWIRTVGDESIETPKLEPEEVDKIYPFLESQTTDDRIYEGVAYLINGTRTRSDKLRRKGIEILDSNLSDTTKYADAYYQLGLAHLDMSESEDAARAFRISAQIDPESSNTLNGLAQAFEALNRSGSAITKLYEQALRLNPSESNIRTNYATFLEGQGQSTAAISEYEKVVRESPNIAKGFFNLGSAYLRIGEFVKAEENLKEALHLDPDYSEALGNLGILAASQEKLDDALGYFERALDANPQSSVAQGNMGSTRLNQGRMEEAKSYLLEAIRLDSSNLDALTNMAILYVNLSDDAKASEYIARVLAVDPQNAKALSVAQIIG